MHSQKRGSAHYTIFMLPLTIFLGLAACSSFEARKLEDRESIQAGDGIPYFLTKAEPRLTRTVTDSKVAYDLSIAHVPDPSARYTLRSAPNLFADVDFTVEFEEEGTLSSVNLVTTERITPTITAIGTLAAALLPFVAIEEEFGEFANSTIDRLRAEKEICSDETVSKITDQVTKLFSYARNWADMDTSVDAVNAFQILFYVETEPHKQCLGLIAEDLSKEAREKRKEIETKEKELEDLDAEVRDPALKILQNDAKKKQLLVSIFSQARVFSLAQRHAHEVQRLQRELNLYIKQIAIKGKDPESDPDAGSKRLDLAKSVGKKAFRSSSIGSRPGCGKRKLAAKVPSSRSSPECASKLRLCKQKLPMPSAPR